VNRAIPAAFQPIDDSAYTSDGGCPTHAGIGCRISQNGRFLYANMCRSWSHSFDCTNPYQLASPLGLDLGYWVLPITPGKTLVEWQLIADLTGDWLVKPYNLSPGSTAPWTGNWENAVTLTGDSGETAYEGIYCPVMGDSVNLVGLAMQSVQDYPKPTTGIVLHRTWDYLQAAAGISLYPSVPNLICVIDYDTDEQLTVWHQVVGNAYETDIADDTVDVSPHWTDAERVIRADPGDVTGYAIQPAAGGSLFNLTCAECVPTEIRL
jgi:hypothetical protein